MKLKWYGHSCFKMTFENGTTLLTDPFDASTGYPLPEDVRADIVTVSHDHFDHSFVSVVKGTPEVVRAAGCRELNGVRLTAIPSYHDDAQGAKRGENLIFVIEAEGLRVAHLGDLGHLPDAAQLDALKDIDVMLLPIGGYFTIDTEQALSILRETKPRCAIAMHFRNEYCRFTISDETAFAAATHAALLPNEIEITDDLPAAAVMRFEA